jgi:hypothetical protein
MPRQVVCEFSEGWRIELRGNSGRVLGKQSRRQRENAESGNEEVVASTGISLRMEGAAAGHLAPLESDELGTGPGAHNEGNGKRGQQYCCEGQMRPGLRP